MEIKENFTQYSKEEQKELLLHWWAYMDVIPYSLVDVKMLEEIIDINSRAVFRAAFAAYQEDRPFNKAAILRYLQHYACFKEYNHFFDVSTYFAKEYLSKKQIDEFLNKIVESYNQTRCKVPVVRDCVFIEDSNDIPKEEDMKLTKHRVMDLFSKCIIKDINKDEECFEVYSDFTIGQGIEEPASVFRTSSLNEHRAEIADCISMLPNIDEGVSVLNLGSNKYGRSWTENSLAIDQLVRLGIACDLLYFPFSKDEWVMLPGGKPFVARYEYDKNKVVSGHSPNTYEEVVKEYKKNLSQE